MPLIEITTNLKSLTYGDFGSEEPLVTKSITSPPDRNGLSMEVGQRTDDLKRIGKLLIQKPGIKFLANQTALNILEDQIQNPRPKKTAVGQLISNVGSGALSTVKLVGSTLAQVPVNGTGTHFVKGFAGKKGYLPRVQGHVLSREGATIGIAADNFNITSSIFESPDDTTKQGDILRKYQEEKEQNISSDNYPKFDTKEFYDAVIGGLAGSVGLDAGEPDTIDKPLNEPLSYYTQDVAKLAGKNFEQLGLGYGISKMQNDHTLPVDVITHASPRRGNLDQIDKLENISIDEKLNSELFQGDLVKFNFKIIQPSFNSDDFPSVYRLDFRAYLDSFNDSYNSDWNTFKYLGRAEDFHTYSGFDRNIQFGFKVAASSAPELSKLMSKLNWLAGSLAPTYVGSNFMRGNFVAVTIGDYLINQPGFFSSLSFDWQKDYPWNTTLNSEPENTGEELPTVLDVTVSFTPVHMGVAKLGTMFIGGYNQLYLPPVDESNLGPEIVVTAKRS